VIIVRIAVFSDVHSNYPALEAVLRDIENRNVDKSFCLGDLVGYGPYPNKVIREIRKREVPTIQGNYDQGVGFDKDSCGCAYKTEKEKETGAVSLEWTKENTSDENKVFLKNLPFKMEKEIKGLNMLLVHGSPRRRNEYLYEDRPEDSLARMVKDLDVDLMMMGHTHIPYHRIVEGVHLVNVGSVGKQKDGDPRASYTLIEINGELGVDVIKVEYPVTEVARRIKDVGLPPDFAEALWKAK
jgi:putative phosphoesterase